MLTVLRLLRIGWRFPEGSSETLGMTAVDDVNSPWHRIIPVPRTLLNQLNHELELELVQLHKEVLRAIQDMFRNHRRSKLLSATFATFLLLHVLELDAGRLIHWIRHKDPQLWIHPDRPDVLMQSSLSACDSLLCHYFIAFGARPVHEYQNSRYKSSLHGRDMAIAEELEMCISQHGTSCGLM
ncbi:hypothetical protein EDB81DRAFT_671249 [Dactylonectria macrodidyma]|uniref:Uncharacterized protein n=1 Tax=Dactylonectria macrodidyma TaxID=307937 RepID=A0A9P9D373_9HYPO|nr:hypothetical protein EDB81DRAFT_671249 [Dactylonectria macrodidyma]